MHADQDAVSGAPTPTPTPSRTPTPTPAHGGVRVSRSITIPEAELHWQFSASGGPGGQHANTANTRAELTFDIGTSPALGPVQRQRLLDRFGPSLRVVASDTRSQVRNRQLAQDRLVAQLVEALQVEKPRRATRPSKAATARRLDAKAIQSKRKSDRRRPREGSD